MDVHTVCILNLNKTWMIQINPSRPFQYILDCTCQNGLSASISMKIRTGIEHYSLSYLIVTYDPTKQQIHILICQTKQKSISTNPYAHWNLDFKIHKAYILIWPRTRSASKTNITTTHRGGIYEFFYRVPNMNQTKNWQILPLVCCYDILRSRLI